MILLAGVTIDHPEFVKIELTLIAANDNPEHGIFY